MASSTGAGIHGGQAVEPVVLPAVDPEAHPAVELPVAAPKEAAPSPNAATLRRLPGGLLEVWFAPGSSLTPALVKQVSVAAAAAAEPEGAPAHLMIDVSALDGVDPNAACVLGASRGIGRIAFLGSGPADRVTARFVASELPPGTDALYVQDRDEALRYLDRNA